MHEHLGYINNSCINNVETNSELTAISINILIMYPDSTLNYMLNIGDYQNGFSSHLNNFFYILVFKKKLCWLFLTYLLALFKHVDNEIPTSTKPVLGKNHLNRLDESLMYRIMLWWGEKMFHVHLLGMIQSCYFVWIPFIAACVIWQLTWSNKHENVPLYIHI